MVNKLVDEKKHVVYDANNMFTKEVSKSVCDRIISVKFHSYLAVQNRDFADIIRSASPSPLLLLSFKSVSRTHASFDIGVPLRGNAAVCPRVVSVRINLYNKGPNPTASIYWGPVNPCMRSVLPANAVDEGGYVRNIPVTLIANPQFLILYVCLLFQQVAPFELHEVDVGDTLCYLCQ
jgi:hypothetical protein